MKAALQDHQIAAVSKVPVEGGLLMYHGLGSGKTLSSIAATHNGSSNVITPASLRTNFKKELNKFLDNDDNYNIISYNRAVSDEPDYKDAIIVDEIHNISNSNTARSKKILDLARNHKLRIGLTGTPIVNSPSDIAPILHFLSPDSNIPLNKAEFDKNFIKKTDTKLTAYEQFVGIKPGVKKRLINTDVIRDAIRGKVHYYTPDKDDYPDVKDEIVNVKMSKDQADVYKAITKKLDPVMAYKVKKNMPMSGKELSKMNFFMSAVRQVSNDAGKFGYHGVTPKIQKIVDDTVSSKASDKNFKGLIYSNYLNSGINKIESELNDYGVKTKKYNGKMSDKSKQDAVNKYNKGEIDVLLVSSAGSEGLDLKGTKLVQITEPHWNKTKIDQVIGRAARFKSHSDLPEDERVVKVKRYHSVLPSNDTSADEYLYNMSVEKDELNNQILDILKEEGSRKYIKVNT